MMIKYTATDRIRIQRATANDSMHLLNGCTGIWTDPRTRFHCRAAEISIESKRDLINAVVRL